jgi:hypothetical protein
MNRSSFNVSQPTAPARRAPRALGSFVRDGHLVVSLDDGREVSISLSDLPGLAGATPSQLANVRLIGRGQGIHWPDLDEDLSVAGLIRDGVVTEADAETEESRVAAALFGRPMQMRLDAHGLLKRSVANCLTIEARHELVPSRFRAFTGPGGVDFLAGVLRMKLEDEIAPKAPLPRRILTPESNGSMRFVRE